MARNNVNLKSPESVGLKAAQRALRRLNARQLSSCQVPVLFEADIVRTLLGHFLHAISGSSLYRKSSFLVAHLGKSDFPLDKD